VECRPAPDDVNIVGSKALSAVTFSQLCANAVLVGKNASLGDHSPVVNAVAVVHVAAGATALISHVAHHTLETHIAANTTNEENITTAAVRHGTLSDLNQHSKDCFLE
jgi:hypothetical protein